MVEQHNEIFIYQTLYIDVDQVLVKIMLAQHRENLGQMTPMIMMGIVHESSLALSKIQNSLSVCTIRCGIIYKINCMTTKLVQAYYINVKCHSFDFYSKWTQTESKYNSKQTSRGYKCHRVS